MDNIDYLSESLVDRVLATENLGWSTLLDGQMDNEGLDLDTIKRVSKQLRELTATHPLFTRGDHLRSAYIFGRGMSFSGVDKPRIQKILTDQHNVSTLFGVEAHETANRSLFTDGLYCVIRNVGTNQFTTVPVSQIGGVVTNPDDASDWWYVVREWHSNRERHRKAIPVARHFANDKRTSIRDENGQSIKVDATYRAYVKHSNRQSGWTFGVPDSLPALIHALTYTGYLKDQATLVHALSKFAWNITTDSSRKTQQIKTRTENIGAGSVGNAAIGDQVTGVGVPSAQVNFNNGQPLAALVAASFGVPVIALLSSPGATGGSYGAAQTLDAPTLKGFEVIQNTWGAFYQEILIDLGAKDARVGFASIESDQTYRQISSIAQAHELGLIWEDEARDAIIDLLDVTVRHDGPMDEPPLLSNTTTVSGQGNSADGAVGATTNPGGDTNNDNNE